MEVPGVELVVEGAGSGDADEVASERYRCNMQGPADVGPDPLLFAQGGGRCGARSAQWGGLLHWLRGAP